MWFYIPEWFKFWNKQVAEDRKFSELIKKRAEEQNAVLDKAKTEASAAQVELEVSKVAEKDLFE